MSTSGESHWLDKYIVEQAKSYGMTVEQHADLMSGAATMQEELERVLVDDPKQYNLLFA
jgi:hypothetical protein